MVAMMEIRVSRRRLMLLAGALFALAALPLLLGLFALIGSAVTPYDANGQPVLLRPEIVAAEAYRARVTGWLETMQDVHADLTHLLDTGGNNLYADSTAANDAHSRARAVAEAIQVAPAPPPAMTGLWDDASRAAAACLDAASLTAIWVGAPSEDFLTEAQDALTVTGEILNDLARSPWLAGEPVIAVENGGHGEWGQ
ncbi:MAG: hypothetical protein JXB47_01040 [Anaerolineae bacterium]|nr:hypothetical protein [Anaerolineae bacterium]